MVRHFPANDKKESEAAFTETTGQELERGIRCIEPLSRPTNLPWKNYIHVFGFSRPGSPVVKACEYGTISVHPFRINGDRSFLTQSDTEGIVIKTRRWDLAGPP